MLCQKRKNTKKALRINGDKISSQYRAIDFFCGGGGMTYGLTQAGISVIAGIDIDKDAKETYEYNNQDATFILANVKHLRSNYFEKKIGVKKNDDNLILVGCSPCQFYSILNTDKNKSQKSKNLLKNFARFVEYYRPGFVLVENVPGIVSHKDSILPFFLKKLTDIGYGQIVSDIVDMSHFGVPQTRRRFSLIASRLTNVCIKLPVPDKKRALLRDVIGEENGFPKIPAGHKDITNFNHTTAGLSDTCLKRLSQTSRNGGNRLDWANDPDLQLPCFIGKNDCFKDTYGRMHWDRPASTITTKFFSISNGRFGHPDENRALSLREGATIQTFPKNYVFKTHSIAATAKLIGNAVPCEYARRLGKTICELNDNGTV